MAPATTSPKRIVLTGGPGAGKTAVLELVKRDFCGHVAVLPEAAGVIFGGGFPRGIEPHERRAAQRAIFHVERELEALYEHDHGVLVVVCDRGTLDGVAYWPGSEPNFCHDLGIGREDELRRYDAVIHLRVPGDGEGYDNSNPLRIETAALARVIDARIAEAWRGHERRWFVAATTDFLSKARHALRLLRAALPEPCRSGRCDRARRTNGGAEGVDDLAHATTLDLA